MIIFALSLLLSLSQETPPTDEIRKLTDERNSLRQEIEKLRKTVAQQEQELLLLAQELLELRRTLRPPAPTEPEATRPAEPPAPAEPAPVPAKGPEKRILSEVLAVHPGQERILIGGGRAEGIEAGYRFEIHREADGKEPRIALAEVVKLLGKNEEMSLLRVVEGNITDIKEGDSAIAIRRESPVPSPATPLPPEPRRCKVTGTAGKDVVVDFGIFQGGKQGMKLNVFREDRPVAVLRLESVNRDFSVASIVEKHMEIELGDEVRAPETRKTALVGKIILNDKEQGIVVDVRKGDGVAVGSLFTVRRGGKVVGKIVLSVVNDWGCYAKPHGESKSADFARGDFIEADAP